MKNITCDIIMFGRVRIAWSMLQLGMFRELRLIGGIGARIVHNIPVMSTRNALEDLTRISVTSAKR